MPRSTTQPFGQHGEQLAVHYLKQHGYQIVRTNWHCRHGEIDIIALKNKVWIFVEVRTRHANTPEGAFASVTPRKQSKMLACAQTYVALNDLDASDWRVDVIGIAIPRRGAPIIEHAEDALGW